MLSELVPEGGQQTDLLGYLENNNRSGMLTERVDSINRRYKRSKIHLASEGTARTWSMRRSFKSPNYTGDWHELPVVANIERFAVGDVRAGSVKRLATAAGEGSMAITFVHKHLREAT